MQFLYPAFYVVQLSVIFSQIQIARIVTRIYLHHKIYLHRKRSSRRCLLRIHQNIAAAGGF